MTTTPTNNAPVSGALTFMLANFGEPDFHTRARVGSFHLVYSKRPDVRVDCYRHPHPWELLSGALRRCEDVETSGRGQTMHGRDPKVRHVSGSMLLCDDGVNTVFSAQVSAAPDIATACVV